jgi:hypothetical protein
VITYVAIAVVVLWGVVLPLYFVLSNRRALRQGVLNAHFETGRRVGHAEALEASQIDVRWEAGPWELKELQ